MAKWQREPPETRAHAQGDACGGRQTGRELDRAHGRALYRAVVDADLEGIVAKRLADAYLNRDFSQRRGRPGDTMPGCDDGAGCWPAVSTGTTDDPIVGLPATSTTSSYRRATRRVGNLMGIPNPSRF